MGRLASAVGLGWLLWAACSKQAEPFVSGSTTPGTSDGGSADAGCKAGCDALGANCGTVLDACGATLNCGTCAPGLECGAGGTTNLCSAPTRHPGDTVWATDPWNEYGW